MQSEDTDTLTEHSSHTLMSQDKIILALGIPLHAIFFALMLAQIEPFHTFFYLFAWWTFIPVIAAINRLKTGRSLVLGNASRIFWMASCSIVVWLVFEIWNFRFLFDFFDSFPKYVQ